MILAALVESEHIHGELHWSIFCTCSVSGASIAQTDMAMHYTSIKALSSGVGITIASIPEDVTA